MDLLLYLENRRSQPARLLRVGLEEVVRDALGGLWANARQPAQLVEEALQRVPVVKLVHP